MNFDNNEFTLLTKEQLCGNEQIEIINKIDKICAVSDFAVLLGGCIDDNKFIRGDNSLKGRGGTCFFAHYGTSLIPGMNTFGDIVNFQINTVRTDSIRPILKFSNIFDIFPNGVKKENDILEVEYGEYPQYAVNTEFAKIIEADFLDGKVKKTGKTYKTDARNEKGIKAPFSVQEHEEYEYNGKRYVRTTYINNGYPHKLSNGKIYKDGDIVWLKVEPLKWIVDEKNKLMLSKTIITSVTLSPDLWKCTDFKSTDTYKFLNSYFAKDIIPDSLKKGTVEEQKQYKEEQRRLERKINPYGLNFGQVSEEQIIKGAIESGVAVFLHGSSSVGKSARVKQIDPDCIIIYLRNSTPESLNGKSVYNSETGEIIDVKPSWLKKLETKCESEPDRMHIVFFDEITNALPSIQGIAFNIVLDREVNGIWKLPENARIVAAGNDLKDSLAANQLAEPLFNRFAHVYIKTTTQDWLKWASEHNIHPAIYSYIAYTNGETLRSEYNGETPNADPRKWEMASKMLYATGNPEMLRSLVGNYITKEFVQFCKQSAITLDDVIKGNYGEEQIQNLNTAERYITTLGLSQVKEENLDMVRSFVIKLGAEYEAIFDALWVHDDKSRLERIAEAKLENAYGKGISR